MKQIGIEIKNNIAYMNNHNLVELAKEYKTPLYVMNEKMINDSILIYEKGLSSNVFETSIVYASKAFLTEKFAMHINSYGLWIDAVSLGDLFLLKKCGFPLNHVVFHGNNKSIEELEFAVKNEIGLLVIDNEFELDQLILLTNILEKKMSCLIRVNPGIDAHTHSYIQTALFSSKFGESIYDEPRISSMINKIKQSNFIDLLGFHAHIGSQIHEIEPFLLLVDKMVEFTNSINHKFNLKLNVLNLGGGIGIKYFENEHTINTFDALVQIKHRIEQALKNSSSFISKIMIEPGRSIVGEAGVTLYECSYIKTTYGKKNYLFIDGGMTDNIRPALYGAIYECDVVNKMNDGKNILVDVVGKCCESGDFICKDVLIPKIDKGDILMVYSTGAYNYSMFSSYNNMLRPAVIMVGDEISVLSKRQKLEQLLQN